MGQNALCGTGVALVTPFNEDGTVDYASLENVVEHVIKGGVDYLVVMGTTGESVTINYDEKKKITETILEKNNNRLPVVYGIGGNDTLKVAEAMRKTDMSHFAAILSVSPYYNKPSQEGIYQHFKFISGECAKPIILYNVPGRTGKSISAETTLRLAHDFKNIIAIKEASGDLNQISSIIKSKPEGFMIVSGDDAMTLPILAIGGCGVISVIANALPDKFSKMVNLANKGDFAEARKIHLDVIDLIDSLFVEGSPAGIKAALHKMGLIKNHVRLPLVKASDGLYNKISSQLNELGY